MSCGRWKEQPSKGLESKIQTRSATHFRLPSPHVGICLTVPSFERALEGTNFGVCVKGRASLVLAAWAGRGPEFLGHVGKNLPA